MREQRRQGGQRDALLQLAPRRWPPERRGGQLYCGDHEVRLTSDRGSPRSLVMIAQEGVYAGV